MPDAPRAAMGLKVTRFVGVHVIGSLLLGGAIYILWRSTDIVLFGWLDAVGATEWVTSARDVARRWGRWLPPGVLYSLPDLLWVYSATACFHVLGPGTTPRGRTGWSMLGVGTGLIHETGQGLGLFRGTYDTTDIFAYGLGFVLAHRVARRFVARREDARAEPREWPPWRDHLHMSRPVMGLYVSTLLAFGYGLAHWDHALNLRAWGGFLTLWVGWMALHVGTLLANAWRDRDSGPIAMGTARPVHPETGEVAFLALFGATVVGCAQGDLSGALLVACVLLAVLYSRPVNPWKGHRLLGPVVNIVGYGVATPLAGYLVVGVPFTLRAGLTLVGIASCVLAIYFFAQSYQEEEDRARGDETLVATHGTGAVIRVGQWCLRAGEAVFVILACIGFFPRTLLLTLVPMGSLDRRISRWAGQIDAHDMTETNRVIRRAAYLVVFAFGLALAHHLWTVETEGRYAGYGTVSGHAVELVHEPTLPPTQR